MKKTLSVLLAVLMIVSIAPIAVIADGGFNEFTDYYGRNALAALPNGEALVYAYDRIAEGVAAHAETISVYDGVHPLAGDDPHEALELKTVIDAYRRDYVQHFWIANEYNWSFTSKTVTDVSIYYTMDELEVNEAKNELEAVVASILEGIDPSMSDWDIELYFHDYLCSTVDYTEAPNCYNAYGALIERKAVCEGYAEAFQLLLARVGIPVFTAIGDSDEPVSGTTIGHEWSYVMLDGNWYHVDVTWDDQEYLFHQYFNLSDEVISEDHRMTQTAYALPVCSSNDAFYFNRAGLTLTEYDAETIGALMKNNGLAAQFYIADGVDEFIEWYDQVENIKAIARVIGITGGFGYSRLFMEREAHIAIIISPSGISLPAQIELLVGESVCLEPTFTPVLTTERGVIWESDDESVVTVDENGVVTAVGDGSANITVTAVKGGASAVCAVVVDPIIPGDADGDREVNALDVIAILKYLVGYTAENAPELANFNFTAADFNGDSKVNNRDILDIMYAIVNGNV